MVKESLIHYRPMFLKYRTNLFAEQIQLPGFYMKENLVANQNP